MRRYGDPVEVRPVAEAESGLGTATGEERPGTPDCFLWRGRLYVVRSVLGHWRERRAWWNESAAQALHGDASSATPEVGPEAGPEAGPEVDPAPSPAVEAEREIWRVEASAGQRAGVGVYDLCHEAGSVWSLLRIAD
jgi:hypothetical protein